MEYCIKCGSNLAEEAAFCHKCGQVVEHLPAKPMGEPVSVTTKTPTQYYPPAKPKRATYTGEPRHRKNRPGLLVAFIVIAGLIVVPIVLIAVFGPINYVYLDSDQFAVNSFDVTTIELTIDNDIGDVTVFYDESAENLFYASITVSGRDGSDLSKIREFTSETTNDTVSIDFYSGDQDFFFWNKDVFEYDIDITLHPDAEVIFDIISSTGDVELYLEGYDNLVISELNLESNTGHVWFYSESTTNVSLGSIDMNTDTGSVKFDLDGALNTTIDGLQLETNTGSVVANLGKYTLLNTDTVDLDDSTGSITLTYEDILYTGDLFWDLETSTGRITVDITQNIVQNMTFEVTFDLTTSTGRIYVYYTVNPEIGLKFDADTSTGSINVPDDSVDYLSKANKYYFDMSTSTGSVTAEEN